MSAFGTKRTLVCATAMSAFGGKADIAAKCLCAMKHGVSRANTVARGSGRQSQSGRRLSFNMMPYGGHWGAPSVMAAFAGFVHDRESTANDERNDDNDAY